MIKKTKCCFALKALVIGFLGSTVLYSKSDQQLTTELEEQYRVFCKSVPKDTGISPQVQFIRHLCEISSKKTNDEYAARKLVLLIYTGAGVGGIGKRPATVEEEIIYFGGIYTSYKLGAKRSYFSPQTLDIAHVKGHQEYTLTVFNFVSAGQLFRPEYWTMKEKTDDYYHAIHSNDWSALINKNKLGWELIDCWYDEIIPCTTSGEQIHLMEKVITLPNKDEQSAFLDVAAELLSDCDDDSLKQESVNGLINIKTDYGRKEFIPLIEQQHRLQSGQKQKKTTQGIRIAATAASLIKPEMTDKGKGQILELLGKFEDDRARQRASRRLSRILAVNHSPDFLEDILAIVDGVPQNDWEELIQYLLSRKNFQDSIILQYVKNMAGRNRLTLVRFIDKNNVFKRASVAQLVNGGIKNLQFTFSSIIKDRDT